MEHGERIVEVNRLLTSGDKMSQKKIAALAEIDFNNNRHGPTGMLRVQWKAPYMRAAIADGHNPALIHATIHGRQSLHHGFLWDYCQYDELNKRENGIE